QAIETLFQDRIEERYPDLAHHYRHSGNTAKGVEYLQRAGQQDLQRSAYAEAIGHVTTALDLLQALPDSVERSQQELLLHTTLGPALMATKGPTDAEVERVYARAQELCQQVGKTPQLFPALGGLHRFYFGRGELQKARELGEQFLRLAERQEDPSLRLTGHWLLGTPLVWLGEVAAAHAHFEQSTALYDPQQHRGLAFRYGLDPGSASQGSRSWRRLATQGRQPGIVSGRRRHTGSRVSSYSHGLPPICWKRKPAFVKPLIRPAASRRNRWSCGRP
ncbi:MAG: hypothetical protein HYZ81_26235, partial [Nitrospinae bacterium]|nr:hypothetical protein [Nitrospinota bacterium]